MKYPVLALVMLLSACSYADANKYWATQLATPVVPGTKYVEVLGRTWTVSPVVDQTAVFMAVRDNNNNEMFGKPVARRTLQAIRAIEAATGCRVVRETMKQDISARFFASVICKS